MRLRISPDMDFYLDMDLQGVTEKTRDSDIQQYEKVVFDEFIYREGGSIYLTIKP